MSSSASRSPRPAASDEIELARVYNCSATVLNILYDAAAGGSGAAQEMLHSLADRLLEAAGKTQRADDSRPPRQTPKSSRNIRSGR